MDLSDSVPQMDAKQQTMMWQQNQYMGDSGIHSGATTQVSCTTILSDQKKDLHKRLMMTQF